MLKKRKMVPNVNIINMNWEKIMGVRKSATGLLSDGLKLMRRDDNDRALFNPSVLCDAVLAGLRAH